MRSNRNPDCSRCNRGRGETFHCMRRSYVFDVDKARKFVADGRETVELDPDDVRYSVDRTEINESHVAHVDPSIPGVVGHVYALDGDGKLVHGHRLLDGHHRAARCLQLGIPFYVYILSEEESVKALMRAPRGARPRKARRQALAAVT